MDSTRPIGIVDALTGGFAILKRRVFYLVIPTLLDLLLWWAPRVSMDPLLRRFQELAPGTASLNLQGVPLVQESNLLEFLSLRMPSLLRTMPTLALEDRSLWEVASGLHLLLLFLVLGALGVIASFGYLEPLAQAVREEGWRPWLFVMRVVPRSRALGAFLVFWLGVNFLTFMVLFFLLSILGAAMLSQVLLLVFQGVIFWFTVAFFFIDGAIFMEGLGPVEAVRRCIQLVWRNFWACLGFYVLVNFVTLPGIALAWRWLLGSLGHGLVLALVAIFTYLYVATGLTAGALIFYRSRVQFLQRAS